MLQAALSDCQFLDLLPFSENGFVTTEVDVSRCHVVQALVVAFVVVVIDDDVPFYMTPDTSWLYIHCNYCSDSAR